MEAAPSLETVLQALHTLYHGDDGGGKEKASVWLGELQKSVRTVGASSSLEVKCGSADLRTDKIRIRLSVHSLPIESAVQSKR